MDFVDIFFQKVLGLEKIHTTMIANRDRIGF